MLSGCIRKQLCAPATVGRATCQQGILHMADMVSLVVQLLSWKQQRSIAAAVAAAHSTWRSSSTLHACTTTSASRASTTTASCPSLGSTTNGRGRSRSWPQQKRHHEMLWKTLHCYQCGSIGSNHHAWLAGQALFGIRSHLQLHARVAYTASSQWYINIPQEDAWKPWYCTPCVFVYYCLQVRTHSLSRPPSGHSHQGCH